MSGNSNAEYDPSNPGAGGQPAIGGASGERTERRIVWLTLMIGAVAAVIVGFFYRWTWAAGLLIGSVLAYLNFRWLRRGMDALVAASTAQAEVAQPRVPVGTYFRALFRYGLIAMIVYVIFRVLSIPLVSMALGLLALGAAAVAASVYEVWHPIETESETEALRGLK